MPQIAGCGRHPKRRSASHRRQGHRYARSVARAALRRRLAGVAAVVLCLAIPACGLMPNSQEKDARTVLREITSAAHVRVVATTWHPQDGSEAYLRALLDLGDVPANKVLVLPGAEPGSTTRHLLIRVPGKHSHQCDVFVVSHHQDALKVDILCGSV